MSVAADRAVGVQALDERRQGGILLRPGLAATVTVAVPVIAPLSAVTVNCRPCRGREQARPR